MQEELTYSKYQQLERRACDWPSKQQESTQIYKINKKKEKQFIYFTPQVQTENNKLFHPCQWCINDFQIGRHLGKGKYGHVYLARVRSTKQIVALKILTKKQIENHDIIFQIRRQIQIHSHLNHINILQMFGFFFDQKKIYIILDYAPKGEMYKVLNEKGLFSEPKSANYIFQMIQALKHIHSLNIIHRDIKPENILLSTDDQIKLTDFGWSIHVSGYLKKRKTFCGTPDYLCPQIVSQVQYDHRIDLWCLGVLTYQFNAGRAPFQDSSDRRELMRRIKNANYTFPQSFSQQLKDFIHCLLQPRPQDRLSLQKAQKHPWISKYYSIYKEQRNQKGYTQAEI